MTFTVRLDQIGRHDLALAGGKGAGLGDLIAAGLPVPAGFVVTTDAYRAVVTANGIQDAILAAHESARPEDPDSLAAAAQRIGQLFASAVIPPEVLDAIDRGYAALPPFAAGPAASGGSRGGSRGGSPGGVHAADGAVPVAVRSSATAEDLEEASFAGQQETFLNVIGVTAVVDAVRRCWASLWSGPAIAYRRREGIAPDDVALAVVVQTLVPADSAGVLFTADPLTGRRDHVVIDATWGLGEALVGGQVTPDHLVVDKASGARLREQIADKRVMTVRGDEGVALVEVDPAHRSASVLSPDEVGQLLAIARSVEQHAGRPTDVEWVSVDGRILVTQARAITTLPPDLLGMEWSRQMLIERYPDPLTPLTWSAVSSTFFDSLATTVRATGGDLPADVPMTRLIHGRAYVNVTAFQRGMQSLPLRPPVAAADGDTPDGATAARSRPSPAMVSAGVGILRMVLGTHRDWERRLPGYVDTITAHRSTRWADLAAADLLAARHTQARALIPMLDNHARAIVAADLTVQLLGGMTKRWLGDTDGELVLTLLSGLTGNLTVQTNRALWRLAQLDPDAPQFERELADVLDRYGHRSPRYEFSHPTWGEAPEQVRELVRLVAAGSPDPAIGEAHRRAAREEATAQARARLSLPIRLVFDRVLALAQTYFRLRENQQFFLVMGVPTMRAILLDLGRRFVDAGWLENPQDVFLFENDEVDALAARLAGPEHAGMPPSPDRGRPDGDSPNGPAGPPDPRALVEQRRHDLERHRRTTAPVHLGGVPDSVAVGDDGLRGIAASRGAATGRARLVRGPEDFAAVRPGEILVAPATSPAWTPLFGVVAGLVTEFGGLLSHAGVVAREYGLPAVLGVPDVMSRIADGDEVHLDGSTGVVTVVRQPDQAVARPSDQAGFRQSDQAVVRAATT